MEAGKSALRIRRTAILLEGNLFGHLSILKDFPINTLLVMNEDWMDTKMNLDIPLEVVDTDCQVWESGGPNISPGSVIFYTDGSKMNEGTGAGITGPGLNSSIPMHNGPRNRFTRKDAISAFK